MQRHCSRWLISATTAVMLCLVGCTAHSPPTSDHPETAGAITQSPSPTAGLDFASMKRDVKKRLASDDVSLQAVRAVLVSVDGKTEVSVYRKLKPTDYSHVFSVTKSVTSILVGIAIDEGRLHLDDTLAERLPKYADQMSKQTKAVTLRQLLTMTAGVDPYSTYNTQAKDAVGQIIRDGFVTDPGTEWNYSNADAHLVSAILQNAVHRTVLDYAREKLFDPLGIDTRPARHSSSPVDLDLPGFMWGTDLEGINSGCCLLKLTAPDMIKIGQLYLDNGRWRGRQLVSAKWVKESTVDQLTTEKNPFRGSDGYGYFWWNGSIDGHPSFKALGSQGQSITVVPDHQLVIVTVCDETGPDTPDQAFDNMIIGAIIRPVLQQ